MGKGLAYYCYNHPFDPACANFGRFTRTGVYLGGEVGYGWGRDRFDFSDTGVPFGRSSTRPQGVIGGGYVGYNLQINPWFVAGLEGSVDGTSLNKSVFDDISGIRVGTWAEIQGSIRGRVGVVFDTINPDWLCLGRFLFYGTGGVAFAGIKNKYSLGAGDQSKSISRTLTGWTGGGGIEYTVTNNWSLRAEYRYSDFGRYTDFVPGGPLSVGHHFTQNQFQLGASYKP